MLNGTVDIGAFEFQGNVTVTTTGDELDSYTDSLSDLQTAAAAGDPVSLRDAINALNNDSAGVAGTIQFDPLLSGGTITLANGPLELSNTTDTITISGPGAGQLTVSGDNASTVFVVDGGVTADISGLTITGGNAFDGGGIGNSGTLTIGNSTISGNSGYNGDGIFNGGTLTVTGSTLSGNSAYASSAGYGGGIFNAGVLTLSNSTLSENSAYNGAGIYNGGSGTLTLNNSTLSGNSVFPTGLGGGIFNAGALTVDNTLVGDNTGYDLFGNAATANFSLIQSNAASIIDPSTDIFGVSPLLGPLGNYGGPTETVPLLSGSPAIDAGSVSLAVDPSGNPLTTDQRGIGYPRTQNGAVDIGAFELAP